MAGRVEDLVHHLVFGFAKPPKWYMNIQRRRWSTCLLRCQAQSHGRVLRTNFTAASDDDKSHSG